MRQLHRDVVVLWMIRSSCTHSSLHDVYRLLNDLFWNNHKLCDGGVYYGITTELQDDGVRNESARSPHSLSLWERARVRVFIREQADFTYKMDFRMRDGSQA